MERKLHDILSVAIALLALGIFLFLLLSRCGTDSGMIPNKEIQRAALYVLNQNCRQEDSLPYSAQEYLQVTEKDAQKQIQALLPELELFRPFNDQTDLLLGGKWDCSLFLIGDKLRYTISFGNGTPEWDLQSSNRDRLLVYVGIFRRGEVSWEFTEAWYCSMDAATCAELYNLIIDYSGGQRVGPDAVQA